ncbi:MAG TPA: hypothetical protein VE326_10230 [Candidatus Binatia bacterium]|nr:hypothetical protein [Candidatus Binatia bacterium]
MKHALTLTEQTRRVATLLAARLRALHPELDPSVDSMTVHMSVRLPVPGRPGHELRADLYEEGATIAYDDGVPPGPAEKILVWGAASDGAILGAVIGALEEIFAGRVVLVREPLSGWVRFIRRQDCDSLLGFVPSEEFRRWPGRRRERLLGSWTWSGATPPSTPA